ncbi:hypothetical protein L873DRAFT_1679566, partial [Choiromyces venosus 120613-1]
KKNILSRFEATGIYPLNSQKVLQMLPGYDSYQLTTEQPCNLSPLEGSRAR